MKVCPTCSSEWPDEQRFCPNDGSALRSAAGAASLIGAVIGGNYHIKQKLGEGGMGAVYLGEHVKMSRKSAIKVMTQSMAHDPDAIARFNREATNAARINHPNVCAIYDFGETPEGLIFLAMEFIEGGSLTSIIEAEGALEPRRAARILQQTGGALQAAHDLGIVHRDLKPDNIMIARGRDGSDIVKVVDFGIAKAMGGEEGQKVTKTGLVVGTPEYMSPEQLSGDKLDGRSDIYSLALVFFRILTGTLPFQAESAQETMIKRLTDDPLKLAEAMPGATFPARLQAIMDRALARMPAERYSSAAEFARDVSRVVEGMAPAADEGATQMISAQDARTTAMPATRVSSASAGKTVVAAPTAAMPRTSVGHAPAGPARKKPVALIAVVGLLVVGGGAAAFILKGNPSNPGPTAETVTPATAQPDPGTNTSRTNPTRPPTTSTAPGGNAAAVTGSNPNPAGNTPNPASNRPGIIVKPTDADDWLFTRLEKISAANAAGIRDTALAFFNSPGISQKDKAFAAYGAGTAYAALGNKSDALDWAQQAVVLDGNSRAYKQLVTDLRGTTP